MTETQDFYFPQLRLQSLKWNYGGEATVRFDSGLVILHGRSQAIRTVFLRLLRFGLGGNAERIDDNFMESIKEIELEFLANGEPVKVIRSCTKQTARMRVIEPEGERELTPREFTEYLIDKLRLPKVFFTNTRLGKSIDVLLSFNDLSRALFVDRDISYPAILSQVPPTPQREIVKVMMGLTTRAVADAENEQRTLLMRQAQVKQELEGVRRFLASLSVPETGEIERRRQELTVTLNELVAQEAQIREQMQARISGGGSENNTYARLRTELLEKRSEMEQQQKEILDLDHQMQEKLDVRQELVIEARRISRHLASQHVISSYTFSQCPRCLQAIESEMYNREVDGLCMLCGRPFSKHEQDVKSWEKARRDVDQLILEASQLLRHYEERKAALLVSIGVLRARVQWLEQELTREVDNYVSPLIEEVRLKAAERAQIEILLQQLNYQEVQRQYANRYETEIIPTVEQELEDIQAKLESLQLDLGYTSARYTAFITHFRNFMRNVNLVNDIYAIDFDEQEFLPSINHQSYKKAVSGPDLAITVLAFHYALLAMSVKEPRVEAGHPKLLVIDEPEQQKMGKDRYRQVMKLFSELAIEHQDEVQIIIATDTRDIPTELEQYAIEF
jgi:hypothetical protein